jgi:hypothetical protein
MAPDKGWFKSNPLTEAYGGSCDCRSLRSALAWATAPNDFRKTTGILSVAALIQAAAMRKPSNLISCSHCGPEGAVSTSWVSWGGIHCGRGNWTACWTGSDRCALKSIWILECGLLAARKSFVLDEAQPHELAVEILRVGVQRSPRRRRFLRTCGRRLASASISVSRCGLQFRRPLRAYPCEAAPQPICWLLTGRPGS